MINKLNFGSGCDSAPGVYKTRNISSLAVREGALLQKAVATNTVILAVQTSDLRHEYPVVGLSTQTTTTASTTIDYVILVSGDLLEFDVTEIANGSTLTATGGSGTTFVRSTFAGMSDNCLIGAKIQVLSCASGDAKPGDILTLTDYTSSGGTMTFASVGSTGFASGDTVKLLSLDDNYVCGEVGCMLNTTYMDSIDLDATVTTTATNMLVRITGTSGDGKRLQGVLLTGCDAAAL